MRTSSSDKAHMVVGKDELIHQIAAKAGLNLKETSKVIDAFTEVVREGVAKGYEVRLMGFGTWNLARCRSKAGQVYSRRRSDYHPCSQTRRFLGRRSALSGRAGTLSRQQN